MRKGLQESKPAGEVERLRALYAHHYDSGVERRKGDLRNAGNRWIDREEKGRLALLLRTAFGQGLPQAHILDIGCGWGDHLAWFQTLGVPPKNLLGVDLLPYRVEAARAEHPGLTFMQANAERLELPDASFDLVMCSLLFSSILDMEMARNIAATIARILRPSGAVVWYDTRLPNPWNRHTRPMTLARIRVLFPGFTHRLVPITLLPQLARRLGPATDVLYPLLAGIPALRSHYLGLLTRSAGAPA